MDELATCLYSDKTATPPEAAGYQMIRGGSYYEKPTGQQAISSTYRVGILANKRSAELGFRLARSQ